MIMFTIISEFHILKDVILLCIMIFRKKSIFVISRNCHAVLFPQLVTGRIWGILYLDIFYCMSSDFSDLTDMTVATIFRLYFKEPLYYITFVLKVSCQWLSVPMYLRPL